MCTPRDPVAIPFLAVQATRVCTDTPNTHTHTRVNTAALNTVTNFEQLYAGKKSDCPSAWAFEGNL